MDRLQRYPLKRADDFVLPKFEIEEDMKDHVANIKKREKERHTQAKENHNKLSIVILQRLSSACGILHAMCGMCLKGRLEDELERQKMYKTKRFCAIKLHDIVKNVCNSSTHVVVDDVVGNMLESLNNVCIIRGNDFRLLPKCLDSTQHRFEVLEEAVFDMASPKFRDECMDEFDNRGQSKCKVHQALKIWKEEPSNDTCDDEISVGKKVLTEVLRALLHNKRSGVSYDHFRRDFSNACNNRSR